MLAAGLPFDHDGKHEADLRVRAALYMREADCPDVWKRVKQIPADDVTALLRGVGAQDRTAAQG